MQTYEQFAVGRPLLIAAVARVGNANDGTQPGAVLACKVAALQRVMTVDSGGRITATGHTPVIGQPTRAVRSR